MSYLYLTTKGDALRSLSTLTNSVGKGTTGGMGRTFSSSATKGVYVSLREGDLGRPYKPTVNSRQAIAHYLKNGVAFIIAYIS